MSKRGVSSRRFLTLLVLFFASGCAALIFEVTWLQLLQLVIGSSAVSVGVLLATYMGGMCLGALAAPRSVSTLRHPLRAYAALELTIGVIGIAELFVIPLAGGVYSAHFGSGWPGMLARGLVCGVCLLPPTILMGATLPVVARWLNTAPNGMSAVGLLYSGNTAGAVLGCLLAGFYLLRVHDTATATFVAGALNTGVAAIAFVLAIREPSLTALSNGAAVESRSRFSAIYPVIGLSGLCALGAEVVWTRLLSLLLGGTVYTFSIILAVFLFGLGIGSGTAALLSRRTSRAWLTLGYCQMLLTVAIAWAAYMIGQVLPYWRIAPAAAGTPWNVFEVELLRSSLAILPAATLLGASFPLALAAMAGNGNDPARPVAGIYAANTAGAIVGALATSLWLIPTFGTQRAQQLLIGLSAMSAFFVLIPHTWSSCPQQAAHHETPRLTARWNRGLIVLSAWAGVALLLVWSVAPIPAISIAYGRYAANWIGQARVIYAGEGINSSVAVTTLPSGDMNFHVSGKVEASTNLADMRLQRMLGHLPALVHRSPRSALIVGMGAGVTAGSFVPYPDINRIVIAEIEPLVPKVIARYFGAYNNNVVRDPRVEIVYDDARHYVLGTPERFDIITTDPIHPWVKGSAALYTREYFEVLAAHLNQGGVVALWVPLYESTPDMVKTEIATFFDVFPHGTVWGNGVGYDVVLLGQMGDTTIDVDRIQQRLKRADYAPVAASLRDVGFASPIELLMTYAVRASDLTSWLADAVRNRDFNLRLQYIAGMGLYTRQRHLIYDEMMTFYAFPADLFSTSEKTRELLKKALEFKEAIRKSVDQQRAKTGVEN
jgi:spermidine synthase